MLLRDQRGRIVFGNSFSNDGYRGQRFDYMLANPPFGVEWKKVKDEVEAEAELGYAGRFGAGTAADQRRVVPVPAAHDLQDGPVEDKGARLAIVFNGSPLFTGAAGSGESEIRRWILENDWLEGIVALPDQLFYNTGISTYFWILSNRKPKSLQRQGHPARRPRPVAEDAQVPRRQAQGDQQGPDHPHHRAVRERAGGRGRRRAPGPRQGEDLRHAGFGYHRITVERPLKLRFEITEDTLAALEESKPLQVGRARRVCRRAARTRSASVWWTKKRHRAGLLADGEVRRRALADRDAPVKAVWSAVSVSDPEGEVQLSQGRHPGTRPGPARLRERPPGRGHRRLLRPRGNPARPRRLDRPRQDEGRLRDPLHPPLLRLHSPAPPGRHRRRAPRPRVPDPEAPGRGDEANDDSVVG